MSDTPRTDAVLDKLHLRPHCDLVAELSRHLERELAAMTAAKNEALDQWRKYHNLRANESSISPHLPGHSCSECKLIAKLEEVT